MKNSCGFTSDFRQNLNENRNVIYLTETLIGIINHENVYTYLLNKNHSPLILIKNDIS